MRHFSIVILIIAMLYHKKNICVSGLFLVLFFLVFFVISNSPVEAACTVSCHKSTCGPKGNTKPCTVCSTTCTPTPITPKPTSIPLNCYYQQVQCIKAPCPTQLVCPSTQCTKACPVGTVCYQPPMPVCPAGKACNQLMPAPQCVPVPTVTPTSCTGPDGSSCITFNCPTDPLMKRPCTTSQGTCKKGQCIATPICTPLPPCALEGVLNANGQRVFCALDPLPGMIYCPRPSTTPSCPLRSIGDANCDGLVNLQDFTDVIKIKIMGLPYTRANDNADFNKDNKTNLVDYEIWRNTFLK